MNIQYCISQIEETEFRYNYDFDYTQLPVSGGTVLQMGHEIKANVGTKEVVIGIQVEIYSEGDKTLLVRDIIRCTFGVTPFDEFVKGVTDNGIEVSAPLLMDTFINVAIGTARGMFDKNLKNTQLQNCILPLIPMDDIQQQTRAKCNSKSKATKQT